MRKKLENTNICITGGTDGIGLSLALKLQKKGANILVIGRKKRTEIHLPAGIQYYATDLSNKNSSLEIAQYISTLEWKNLDYLIHNAGMGYVGRIEEQKDRSIKDIITTNLTTPLMLTQTLFPLLVKKKGTVCFIGSTAKNRATPDFSIYTASKTALSDMARNLRTEWQQKVNIQEINPGPTRTSFHEKSGLKNPPLAFLFMKPEEVAEEIIHCLEKNKKQKNFTAMSLIFFALKRRFSRGIK